MTWVNFIIQILHRLSSMYYICLVFGVPQHNDNKRQPISFLDSIYHLSHPITNYSLIINLEWNEIVFTAIYELMILVESRMSFSRTNCSQLSNGNFSMKHWGGMYGFYVLVSDQKKNLSSIFASGCYSSIIYYLLLNEFEISQWSTNELTERMFDFFRDQTHSMLQKLRTC